MEKTKNTFQDGLIMDFSPDNTSATSLTSALNATILTFNGNEMALQNDMGNGRVETAYLPEGYIPVGTCEFGDIIYIASYNPLTNRSLIGCFPSPERNISSEELGGLKLSLSYTDFQVLALDENGYKLDLPSGELKSTAVRKVLIDNRNTNPGDKYIVFSELASENFEKFGQLDNFKILEGDKVKKEFNFKKYLKLSVVSIDETGKITYLDTDTHYYLYHIENEINDDGSENANKAVYTTYDHFIAPKLIRNSTDVDEYRNMLLSGWNIFSSKNPGKLAILAELNSIEEFSCTYAVIVDEIEPTKDDLGNTTDEGAIKYTVYFTPTFDDEEGLKKVYLSRENIDGAEKIEEGGNVYYEFLVKETLFDKSTEPLYKIRLNEVSDTSQIPDYHSTNFDNFGGPIENSELVTEPVVSGNSYLAFEVIIPRKNGELIKSELLIYSCDIIPAMPYGKLDYLKVPITIDFNKIGSGEVGLTRWRYYNYGTLCTLQYGLEIYNKPGEKTVSVTIDFYDNIGHVARYTLENLDSFSGIHTEYLGLNGENYNYRLNKMVGDQYILHKALEYREFNPETDAAEGFDENSNENPDGLYRITKLDNVEIDYLYVLEVKEGKKTIYANDAGTLYSHLLYAALITVTSDSGSEPKRYWRWLWTNNMYNEYYYQVDDFNTLKFLLDLDVNAIFEAGQTYLWNDITLNNLDNNIDNGCYNTYSANVTYIGLNDPSANINLYSYPGLQNDYGCFNLITTDCGGDTLLDKFKLDIYLGKSKISYSNDGSYEYSMTNIPLTNKDKQYLDLSEITDYSNTLTGQENGDYIYRRSPINTEGINLKDTFNVQFTGRDPKTVQLDDEDGTVNAKHIQVDLSNCYYANSTDKKAVTLHLAASIFTKAFTCSTLKYTGDCPTYSPLISNQAELNGYGIEGIETNGMAFLRMNTAFMGMVGGDKKEYSFSLLLSNNNIFDRASVDDSTLTSRNNSNSYNSYGNNDYVSLYNLYVENGLNKFFIYYPGGDATYSFTSIRGNSGFEEVRNGLNSAYPSLGDLAERKKYCILFIRDKYSKRLPDIDGTKLRWIEDHSAVGILCMKHPSGGFIAFNTIYLDYDNQYSNGPGNVADGISGSSDYGTFYPQTQKIEESINYTQYPNFSYPLYLILSRIYTKNKTIPSNGESVRLSNYVRRELYSTTLTKDVIMKLYLNSADVNIAMSGIDYNQYKNSLLEIVNSISAVSELSPNTEALKLVFSDCAKNTVLTLEINNKQMEFPDIENMALLSYNGSIVPCEKILDNLFYIYYEGKLIPYYDLEYKFDKQTIVNNLSSILGKTISDINMTNALTLLAPLEIELAADDLASAYLVFYTTSEFKELVELVLEDIKPDTEEKARDHIIHFLENCFTSGNERFYYGYRTYSTPQEPYLKWRLKYPSLDMWNVQQYATNFAGENMYEYLKNNIFLVATANRTYEFLQMFFNFKHGDKYLLDLITITPLLGLSENFEYTNSLELKSNSPHNMLKICMGSGGEKLGDRLNGLLCIMKDVSVDITHRITEN